VYEHKKQATIMKYRLRHEVSQKKFLGTVMIFYLLICISLFVWCKYTKLGTNFISTLLPKVLLTF